MVFNIFEYISEDMRCQREENQRLIKEAIEKYGDLEPTYYDEDGFLRHRTIFLGKTKKYANNTLGQVVNDGVVSGFNEDDFINITMRPIIEDNEGIAPYPYLDTNGLITIGVGANINNNPLSMDWYYKDQDTGELRHLDKNNPDDLRLIKKEVSNLEKEREKLPYDEKKKTWENNYKAKHYKGITNLRVSSEYINREYYKRAKEAFNNIQSTIKRYNKDPKKENSIPDFHKLPQPLQFVLMDMMYNMGQTRFDYIITYGKDGKKRGYPSFWDAVANRDVDKMIKECARDGLPKRNKKIQERLRKLKDVVY